MKIYGWLKSSDSQIPRLACIETIRAEYDPGIPGVRFSLTKGWIQDLILPTKDKAVAEEIIFRASEQNVMFLDSAMPLYLSGTEDNRTWGPMHRQIGERKMKHRRRYVRAAFHFLLVGLLLLIPVFAVYLSDAARRTVCDVLSVLLLPAYALFLVCCIVMEKRP